MSQKSVARRLFIREDFTILLVNEPEGYRTLLGQLPPNVTVLTKPTEPFDLIQVFVISRKELEDQLEKLKRFLKPKGLFWVTYPKGRSKIKADINRDSIAKYARTIGLEGVAMISVDDTWSALRLKIV